jgi:hypothetical protein
VTWTPRLVHSRRVDGQPRQQVLYLLPALRSCCILDPLIRAAWWAAIEDWEAQILEGLTDEETERFLTSHHDTIFARLRDRVPPATSRGRELLTEHCLAVERLRQEQERLRQEEQQRWEEARRRQEQQRQEQQRRRARAAAAGELRWWDVMGLSPTATWLEVQQRYRELVMLVHPDRGGDDRQMALLNAAREQAEAELRGR